MARGKKTGGRDFQVGNPGGPGRPQLPDDIKKARSLNRIEFERILNRYIFMSVKDVDLVCKRLDLPMLEGVVAKILVKAFNQGDTHKLEFFIDRLIGKPRIDDSPGQSERLSNSEQEYKLKTYAEFCADAGYPKPYEKQVEFTEFAMHEFDPRMLLGARGYGKTDYAVICGVGYEIYKDYYSHLLYETPLLETNLIVTKSNERNASLLKEIENACLANGVEFEIANTKCIRVKGLIGKDHSVSAVTIKTASLRGRHPKRIIMDDPVTEDDTSDATRKLAKKKYDELIKLKKNLLIIGQPAHKYDLYAELRDKIKLMTVPHGTIKELDADLQAMELAGVDKNSIIMSYHLVVPKDGATAFDNIKYLDTFPIGETAVAFIDPANKGIDSTAISIVKAHFDGVAVVGFCWKKAWNHCLDDIAPLLVKYKVKKVCIETNNLGEMPVEMLRPLLKQAGIGVVGKYTHLNKHAKIMSAGAHAHLIHLCKDSHKAYIKEVVEYEYNVKHDDAPDSLASCLEWIGLIRGK